MKAEQVKTLTLPTTVLGLDISADSKHCYAACLDGGIYEVDVEAGANEKLLEHESFASGVFRVPDSSKIISAGYDGQVQWFDVESREVQQKVTAHKFWSWQSAISSDGRLFASVTGQYMAGSLKYEPAPETEPSVKVFEANTAKLVHELSHVPSVQAVAFSPDNKYLAAGNLMGEIRVWDLDTGKELAKFSSSGFTCWGIIKSHCYQGGIFSLGFSPDSQSILACGMGPIRDPMAGNGKQTWQRFAWQRDGSPKTDEIHEGDFGNGNPESIACHPSKNYFVMAGRLAQGKWNVGFFDEKTGGLIQSLDTKSRLTKVAFNPEGDKLFLAGSVVQSNKFAKDGKYPSYGRVFVYNLAD